MQVYIYSGKILLKTFDRLNTATAFLYKKKSQCYFNAAQPFIYIYK